MEESFNKDGGQDGIRKEAPIAHIVNPLRWYWWKALLNLIVPYTRMLWFDGTSRSILPEPTTTLLDWRFFKKGG